MNHRSTRVSANTLETYRRDDWIECVMELMIFNKLTEHVFGKQNKLHIEGLVAKTSYLPFLVNRFSSAT